MSRPEVPAAEDVLPAPIHEMVRRIVAGFDPDQVILFGSYARGAAGPNSDADLLVVVDIAGPKRPKLVEMHRELAGMGLAKDIILVTPKELERLGREPGSLISNALTEGRLLYDRSRALV